MADEEKPAEAAPAEGAPAPKKKKLPGKKLVLFILLPVLLLGGGGAAAYFTGLLDPLLGKTHAEAGKDGHSKDGADPAADGHGDTAAEGDAGSDHAGADGEAVCGGPAEGEEAGGHGEGGNGKYMEIPPQMIALNSAGKSQVYLKISVSLELAKAEDNAKVTAVLPRVSDQFQTYLRELRPEDLKGSAGLYRLREELLARVNAAAAPVRICDVLFKELIMQ